MIELICIGCPRGCHLTVDTDNGLSVSGNNCPRGEEYGKTEVTSPVRTVTSTVDADGERLPVKTSSPVAKDAMMDVMKEIKKIHAAAPVKIGDVILENIGGTGADLVASGSCGGRS